MSEASTPSTPLEQRILDIGQTLNARISASKPSLFDAQAWQAKLLDWAMQDPSFKVDLFRFVDVLPSLRSTDQVSQHIEEYLLKPGRKLPLAVSAALKAATGSLTAGMAAAVIRKNVTSMAERFIVGSDIHTALTSLADLRKQGYAATVDILGEKVVSESEAAYYTKAYAQAIDVLAEHAISAPSDALLDNNHLGAIPKANVSIKLSALYSQIKATDLEGSVATLVERILPLLLRAKEKNVFVNFDVEQWDLHEVVYRVFEAVTMHDELRSWPHLGIVVQAYLKSARANVERLMVLSKKRGMPLTVRLVKGAYWDYETVLSEQRGWDCPVFQHKVSTDANYEAVSRLLLENHALIWPAFGSHNMRSLANAVALAEQLKVPENLIEVQMLYGMAEPEREAVKSLGQRVRLYCPVGELLPGMAYLVRRLLENTANQSFLRLTHHDAQDWKALFAVPAYHPDDTNTATPSAVPAAEFTSEPLLDYAIDAHRQGMHNAIDKLERALPLKVPVVINGKPVSGRLSHARTSPNRTSQTVAEISYAQVDDVDHAVSSALAAYPSWSTRETLERATLLNKLAQAIKSSRHELSALMAYEVGKPWKEADADVAEAIDFCNYYAQQAMIELAPRKQGALPGEHNTLYYEGRGVAAIISPWNFPFAILCGMSAAALAAGNTVVIKPAEQSSAIAYRLYQLMIDAGFPKEVVHFLPGQGEEIGARLVSHPNVAIIAFTGSKQVGLSILQESQSVVPGQTQVKHVVCEMGGKNAIIIDSDADLDEAVDGAIYSAFGFAGQKCSACSRVLVVGDVYESFVSRLVAAMASMSVGSALDPKTLVGPVVDGEAQTRLNKWIENPPRDAQVLFCGEAPAGGTFVAPTLFEVSDPNHTLMQQELFGPVIALMRCKSFDDALGVANNTEFALTGGVFSRSPSHIDKARKHFKVGNLYINRATTGAYVHRQPFGGFKMSGAGTKAGGPGYLLHFVDMRVVTENTMRRGFIPDE